MQTLSTTLSGKSRAVQENLDRFIPNRSAMDFGYAHGMLTEGAKKKKREESRGVRSPSSEAYEKHLSEIFNMNNRRILAFKNKPSTPVNPIPRHILSSDALPNKNVRYISKNAQKTLEAPDIIDEFYSNILNWSRNNIIAIALDCTVYLYDASNGSISDLVTIDEENGPVTSVSWAPDGHHIAVGLNDSCVQLWDFMANRQLRTLRGGHRSRGGSLAWNNQILTTGGMDGKIINHDMRIRSDIIGTFSGHQKGVCGLKWSSSGQKLASGGDDDCVFIWDQSKMSSNLTRQWIHRLDDHKAAVKALAWCPFQSNLLASGGSNNDGSIKFWNTQSGACLRSVDTGSQVCSLLWSKSKRELLSSNGSTDNQLVLWKYPSMVKMQELRGHTSPVLHMTQSPDGNIVASAAGDETLKFWNVFEIPEPTRKVPKPNSEPFAYYSRIH